MRELKFRAWNKEDYKWVEWTYGEMIDCQTSETIEVMQYTGLKDKNGKEIYEGDIVELERPLTKEKVNGEMIFMYGMFGIVVEGGGIEVLYGCETEVLGNIYQNPELLINKN